MKQQLSKTRIEKGMKKKNDTDLVWTIMQLKKTNPEVARELAKPKRRWSTINLKELSHVDGDLLVPGKVLSAGELSAKKRIVAWSFSEKARAKILEANGEAILLSDEIVKNPQLNGYAMVR